MGDGALEGYFAQDILGDCGQTIPEEYAYILGILPLPELQCSADPPSYILPSVLFGL